MKRLLFIFILLPLIIFISCDELSHNNFKYKIYVLPCINKTSYFGLEKTLKNKIIDEILHDGRLNLVNNKNEAEYFLLININKYIIQKLNFKDYNICYNPTLTYKVQVVLSVTLADKKNNIIFYKPAIRGLHIYTTNIPITNITIYSEYNNNEIYAINYIFDRLAINIVKQIVSFSNFV
jgi:hypothetical protein